MLVCFPQSLPGLWIIASCCVLTVFPLSVLLPRVFFPSTRLVRMNQALVSLITFQDPISKLRAMVNLGYQSDTPGKREPQLTNCLYQLVQWVCLWGIFLLPGPLWVVTFLGRWTWVAHFSKPVVSRIPPGSPSISVPSLCVPGLTGDGLSDGLIPRRVS